MQEPGAPITNLQDRSPAELLALHAKITDELRERGVIRSANNPTGDLAEYLFCKAFGWDRSGPSHPSADATGNDGTLYQIKARRMTQRNTSRQLGALRGLPDGGFHVLAGVLFAPDYLVQRAAMIPHELVLKLAKYRKHTNCWIFFLPEVAWTWPGVRDVTEALRAVPF